jgi:hypothetical protein
MIHLQQYSILLYRYSLLALQVTSWNPVALATSTICLAGSRTGERCHSAQYVMMLNEGIASHGLVNGLKNSGQAEILNEYSIKSPR